MLDTCYWARLQGVSGALDDILANDNAMGQFYIEVLEGDGYLETRCQITSLAAWPEPSELPESLQPGTYMVGRDIAAGTYRGEAGEEVLDTCYWARLQGVSGALDDILANDNAMGQFYIEVLEGDGYLETRCQITSLAAWPEPSELPESLQPGTYMVGRDIAAGTYRGEAGEEVLDTCYWARLQGVSGALDDILANDNAMGQFYIEVLEGDGYLETRCQITQARWLN